MDSIKSIMNTIQDSCPKLVPVFFPRGTNEATLTEDILRNKEYNITKTNKCCVCGSSDDVEHAQLFCDYNLSSGKCSVTKLDYVCPDCKACMDVNYIMNVCFNLKNKEESERLSRHFLLTNSQSPDNWLLFQQIISSAYSLKVLLKNFLNPNVDISIPKNH
ncbi:hypothetical protein WA158_001999 [Blastocystis sp. Blastoise]